MARQNLGENAHATVHEVLLCQCASIKNQCEEYTGTSKYSMQGDRYRGMGQSKRHARRFPKEFLSLAHWLCMAWVANAFLWLLQELRT